jgi:hypothetical protein
MARLFSVNVFAAAGIASRCSGSVGTVIGGNVIAAQPVRSKLAVNSDAVPTAAINKVPRADKTIATGSGSIAAAGRG